MLFRIIVYPKILLLLSCRFRILIIFYRTNMNPKIYNLKEFAARYHLSDIFGAYAAHCSATADDSRIFMGATEERTLFARLFLVKQGCCDILLDGNTEGNLELKEGGLRHPVDE